MSRQLVGVAQAAKHLGMSKKWVYDHASRKHPRVPSIRMGRSLRFDLSDLDRFVDEQAESTARLIGAGRHH